MQPTSTRPWRGVASALALASCLVARPAAADADLQLSIGLNAGYLRKIPSLGAGKVSTTARDIAAGDVAARGGLWLLGGTVDLQLTLDDRWTVPLIGITGMWATGSSAPIGSSLDGSIARLRPDTAFRGDLLLLGVGRRWKHRRFMYGIAARTGVSWIGMDGDVAAGASRTPLDLTATTFLFTVEAEGCRRIDPEHRVCFQVAPRVYEHQFLNGVTFGLRLEWGR